MKITALSLHQMGDPSCYREAVRLLEYMIPENVSDIDCFVHDAKFPFPDYLNLIVRIDLLYSWRKMNLDIK